LHIFGSLALTVVVISGLDWSGDAGDPRKTPALSPYLVTAVVHLQSDHWEALEEALARARRRRSLPTNYVFHFSGSRPQIREAFFDALHGVPFSAHARVVDKRHWTSAYLAETTGDARIQAEIVELIARCPDFLISKQTLLIDGHKRDAGKMVPLKTEINRRLTVAGKAGIRKVKVCPDDHPSQGAIVQVADMIAGALRDIGGARGPYLSSFSSKITLV
jgi:hypothetical protein